jgi:competence protein ComGF
MIVFIILLAVIILVKIFNNHSDDKTIDVHHHYGLKADQHNPDIKKATNTQIEKGLINEYEFEKAFSSFDSFFDKK